jgi:hypothetical protein
MSLSITVMPDRHIAPPWRELVFITKLKDTFEFVEKHGSDKQAFLLARTLKTDLSDIEEKRDKD